MAHDETAVRLNDALCEQAGALAGLYDERGEFSEMSQPVLSEWVLVANLQDLGDDDERSAHRLVVLCAPHMLDSHVIGLLTMARSLP